MTELQLLAVSIALATAGWLYTTWRARQLQQKRVAIDLVHSNRFQDEWFKSVRGLFAKFYDSPNYDWTDLAKRRFDRQAVLSDNEVKLFVFAMNVLNTLEFIAVAVLSGTADEDIIRDSQRYIIVTAVKRLEGLIKQIRKDANNPNAFINVETLADRWAEKGSPTRSKY